MQPDLFEEESTSHIGDVNNSIISISAPPSRPMIAAASLPHHCLHQNTHTLDSSNTLIDAVAVILPMATYTPAFYRLSRSLDQEIQSHAPDIVCASSHAANISIVCLTDGVQASGFSNNNSNGDTGDDRHDRISIPLSHDSESPSKVAYLGERLWWIGMGIMLLGESGNFAAYGFAPAVLVAPLGTITLISNALIAPAFLGEILRAQDIMGIFFSVIGTGIILAVSSQTSEPSLSPNDIVNAITQTHFVVYMIITASVAISLLGISYTQQNRKHIFVDLMIVAIFGGYTVLATKALSSLIKLSLVMMVGHWITYVMLFALAVTAVMQVQHLNRALSLFDSVEVIPINFVLFTISSIVGSAIMYNDLQRTSPVALVGVVFMFFGVTLITRKHDGIGDDMAVVEDGNAIGHRVEAVPHVHVHRVHSRTGAMSRDAIRDHVTVARTSPYINLPEQPHTAYSLTRDADAFAAITSDRTTTRANKRAHNCTCSSTPVV